MPRTAQAPVVEEVQEVTGDITADGFNADTVEAAPNFDMGQVQALFAKMLAENLVPTLQTLLPEMVKTDPMQNGPSSPTTIPMVASDPVKPNYLKHYRMDDAVSTKIQLIDVTKLDEDGEIPYHFAMMADGRFRGDSPAVQKGKWIHFANGHFYASTPMEVAYIEWRRDRDPSFRVYEDKSTGINAHTCLVVNCGKTFADKETLDAHSKATHGV